MAEEAQGMTTAAAEGEVVAAAAEGEVVAGAAEGEVVAGAAEGEVVAAAAEGGVVAEPEKKKRGKPKDPDAPPKPKNAFQQVSADARVRIKAENPAIASDLSAMGLALKAAWEAVPQEEKDRRSAIYEEEMEIWRPKWAVYKETEHYKEFCMIKQDWLEGREKKKLCKKHSKVAPKRPKSGYMIYAGEIRERVQKEVMDAGGGMGDIGKKISENWNVLSEAQKAEYGEMSSRQKEVYVGVYAEYKTTDTFREFMESKAKMEGRHGVKKLERTAFKDAPKRASSAFNLFKAKFMPQVMQENKGVAVGEISKKLAEMWKATDEAGRTEYTEKAAELKEQYDAKLKAFKKQKCYVNFLSKRHLVRARENKMVNLREMPKKPKNVFALFKEDHKSEVPAGKGEGKGMSWVKAKWTEVEAEEKARLEAKEQELKAKYVEDVNAYKTGPKFQEFQKTEIKIKRELTNEAMKVMTLKFLNDAPAQPPRSPFSIYLGEKRRAESEAAGKKVKKARKEQQDEIVKFKQEFSKFDKETKMEYEDKRRERVKAWTEEVKMYMSLPKWKEYIEEAKMLKVPVKSLLATKKNAIKKLKNGMKILPLPDKPMEIPSKPAGARKLFMKEKKGEVEDISTLGALWDALSADDKAKYETEAAELMTRFEEDMATFEASEDGKKYRSSVKRVVKLRRIAMAKDKYLSDMPKKPMSAVALYFKKGLSQVKKEKPELKGHELKQALKERWVNLDPSEKGPLEEQAAQAEIDYKETMALFKSSDNYKSFSKVVKASVKRPKGKAKGKGKAKATSAPQVKKPESMPTRPADAFKAFIKSQAGSGGKGLGEFAKMFRELAPEEKERLDKEAKERQATYHQEFADWNKSAEGKKYNSQVIIFGKRKRLADAKSKFMQDEPKKPPHAFMLYCTDKRSAVSAEFPEIRGLGPVQIKLTELWRGLTADEKQVYLNKEKESRAEYDEKMVEFRKTDDYKKFASIQKRGTPKAKAKGKGKSKAAAKSSGPAKPENLPKKPSNGIQLFMIKQRAGGIGGSLQQAAAAWRELGAEGQKPYQEEAKEKELEYDKAMKEFKASGDGKKYIRLKAASDKKTKMVQVKDKFLNASDAPKEPVRPPSSYQLFVQEKRSTLTGKLGEVAKQLTSMWSEATPEEKKVYDDKADELKVQYDKDMTEFKNSDTFKKYDKALKQINKSGSSKRASTPKPKAKSKVAKAKGKGRGGGASKGKGAKKAAAADSDSDSDVMGSDSDSSSDSDSD
eukprot:CAMPEP_0115150676 /NCGR_PEP_ID=MMETSP0227-20121206/65176_1 /TAXON_ID=89957 /ORGANISM="Polarella glacialis, Strain CCMP 1383" /LENGTH=1249 /DNA_ID=CAMNT_0002561077 /DNA_START=69 /DNA_END=3819 /DNA_ORIENTATION=+